MVKEEKGIYWRDLAIIHIKKNGTVEAPEGYEPTEDEAKAIAHEMKGIEWPKPVELEVRNSQVHLPPQLKNWPKDQLYFFRSVDHTSWR